MNRSIRPVLGCPSPVQASTVLGKAVPGAVIPASPSGTPPFRESVDRGKHLRCARHDRPFLRASLRISERKLKGDGSSISIRPATLKLAWLRPTNPSVLLQGRGGPGNQTSLVPNLSLRNRDLTSNGPR